MRPQLSKINVHKVHCACTVVDAMYTNCPFLHSMEYAWWILGKRLKPGGYVLAAVTYGGVDKAWCMSVFICAAPLQTWR